MKTTARGEVAVVTSAGRMLRLGALELPTLPPSNGAPTLSGGAPLAAYVDLAADERPLTLTSLSPDSPGIALGTAGGIVKRVTTDYPKGTAWEAISLKDGDHVVGAVELTTGEEELVFVTSQASLLHFSAGDVRPQGRGGGGIAGIRLSDGARVIFFGAVDPAVDSIVVTVSGSSDSLPGTDPSPSTPARAAGPEESERTASSRARTPCSSPGSAGPAPARPSPMASPSPSPSPRAGGTGRASPPPRSSGASAPSEPSGRRRSATTRSRSFCESASAARGSITTKGVRPLLRGEHPSSRGRDHSWSMCSGSRM